DAALHLTRALPVVGMTGEVLLDIEGAQRLARAQAAAVAALCLAFGALLFLATERRRALSEANAALERQVAKRTAALNASNTELRREATEREEAQAALRRAQADLVQAGKLSALGQMSAGISHELNQPLMAIRSFAENAVQFLERDRPDRTAENLTRISQMA
ncbi:MAG TPA: C4-dicarboxylate ABC transporter, partial [Sulfitobacter pontiacus]|nr:C4-dicarboxylate ABC transporter [Sulfitobacter pontiacus]